LTDVDAVWAAYVAGRDVVLRNALVEHYRPLVDRVTQKILPGLPSHVDAEDLRSAGVLGLIDAVTRFEPERGVTFTVFAWTRIQGEIVEQLRRDDGVRRAMRSVARSLANAVAEATRRLQRTPSDEEIAAELGVNVAAYEKLRATAVVAAPPRSLDRKISHHSQRNNIREADTLADVLVGQEDDLGDEHDINELREVVAASWNALPDRERTILTLRYIEGLTLQEAGAVLGIAASRVSQIATEGVRLLRSEIAVR